MHLSRRQLLTDLIKITATGSAFGLSGCTVTEVRRSLNTGQSLYKGQVKEAIRAEVSQQIPLTGMPAMDGLVKKQLAAFMDQLFKQWGEQRIASPKEYVKYTDQYRSRALIDFDSGKIRVETLEAKHSKTALKNAIVSTLLTPEDPSQVDLFSAKPIAAGKTPFLHDLVHDQDGKAVRYSWRANRFADYLVRTRYRTYEQKGHMRHAVDFDMTQNHQATQKQRYHNTVMRQARRFKIEPALIYGIIETESAFNPYAVSSAPAYGLMQIVPATAGRDVHRLLYKRDGMPSKQTLFQAERNIEYGTAYLSILFNRYLAGIHNARSREYCVIAAYNTGSGNVLKAFDANRKHAIAKINRLNSQQVYQHLRTRLTYAEARRYLLKVTTNKRNYLT
ncbi:MAG: murein transglycosylase domain-containing protein [Thiomicrorhabdus chilensis]|uniref:murein transglycosylase domain-containing protein n=1 Tax=Thiomicrorhabdus chilensis TaxID=63656 RepID=UPI00299F522E|nr:murein transglycosylase domain-containing protein [Thiomicrorhabdus chilensis]MDX1348084.1 murein transglycosylase domain-containing protein [Thiomicrorhabdus chilensis]